MNERVLELIEQAADYAYANQQPLESVHAFGVRQFEKYTELVVAECINQIRKRKIIAVENGWKVDESMSAAEVDIEDWFDYTAEDEDYE